MRTFTLSAERLQAIRAELNLTQDDMSAFMGVKLRTYNGYESALRPIPEWIARLVWYMRWHGIPREWM